MAVTLGAVTFLLGGSLQTGAQSKEMMLAGRFFAGMAIGQLVGHKEILLMSVPLGATLSIRDRYANRKLH